MPEPTISLSVVITVHNGGASLRQCLASLGRCRDQFAELIVVDDGSQDDALVCAPLFGARILPVGSRRGPGHGRNVGVLSSASDIVVLLDADVCVADNTISRILKRFQEEPDLGALFGSYDRRPAAPGLVSQFRNLLHCFVHKTSNRRASTFWAGCGAIRRDVFLRSGGFDIAYSVPCVEDIELGMRLTGEGVRIALDPSIEVKHLKNWTLPTMIFTDICRRGIPWTRLILNSHRIPNDLNLRLGNRISVVLTALLCSASAFSAVSALHNGADRSSAWQTAICLTLLLGVVGLNLRFYRFLAAVRGAGFAVRSIPLHLIYFLCCGVAFLSGIAIHYWLKLRSGVNRVAALAIGRG